MGRTVRQRAVALFGVCLVLTGLVVITYALGGLKGLELNSVDTRFSIRGSNGPPKDMVVVKIDDRTFNDLNQRWPFPRSLHARLIDRLRRAGAKVIAYDVQFTEPSANPAEDDALISAVGGAGNVVLATTEVDRRGRTRVFGGDQVVRSVHATSGDSIMPFDRGGVIRRVPYEVDGLESFGVRVAERASGRDIHRSDFPGNTAWIDYAGPPGTVKSVSFSSALLGRVPPSVFRGKLVFVGASAPSLQDLHPTSVGSDMDGPEIQANATSTIVRDFPLKHFGVAPDVALILLLGMVAPLANLRLSVLRAVLVELGAAALFCVAVQLLFNSGWIAVAVYPLLALAVSSIGALGVSYLITAFERERVRDVFSRFVPDAVVDQVLARTDEHLRLGGVELVGTSMFTDLRGFTSFAESLEPEKVIEILNRYLAEMSDAILDHGGTLISYMGDGIMAVFGAPIRQDDHADRALATAEDMLTRLERFNEWLRADGNGEGFKMGIGLNSGSVMSGNVGSERRLEYTAIGDTANTAARLEGMTKGTPYQLFMAESTRELLTNGADRLEFVDEMEVRGRQRKLRVWALPETARVRA